MSFSVAAALDAFVASEKEPRPPDGFWHPSSVSGCRRKAVYEMRGVERTNPETPMQTRNFYVGHTWHAKFQAAVAASPDVADVFTEVRVTLPDLNTTGAADQVVIFSDGDAELEEFKTIKEWGYKKLTGPKDDHLQQVKPYMLGLRLFGGTDENGKVLAPLGDRLKRVRFVYIEKQVLDTKEFVVEWDPAWEDEYRSLIADLDSYIADPNSLPPRMPSGTKGKPHWMCSWGWGVCPFFDRCYQEDPDEVAPEF